MVVDSPTVARTSTSVLPIPRFVEIAELVKIFKEAIDVNANLDTNLIQVEKLVKTSMNVQILLIVEKDSVEIHRVVFRYNKILLGGIFSKEKNRNLGITKNILCNISSAYVQREWNLVKTQEVAKTSTNVPINHPMIIIVASNVQMANVSIQMADTNANVRKALR